MADEKAKVLVTIPFHDFDSISTLSEMCDVEVFEEPREMTKEELIQGVKDKHALLIESHDIIDKEVLTAAGKQLKVIATNSAG